MFKKIVLFCFCLLIIVPFANAQSFGSPSKESSLYGINFVFIYVVNQDNIDLMSIANIYYNKALTPTVSAQETDTYFLKGYTWLKDEPYFNHIYGEQVGHPVTLSAMGGWATGYPRNYLISVKFNGIEQVQNVILSDGENCDVVFKFDWAVPPNNNTGAPSYYTCPLVYYTPTIWPKVVINGPKDIVLGYSAAFSSGSYSPDSLQNIKSVQWATDCFYPVSDMTKNTLFLPLTYVDHTTWPTISPDGSADYTDDRCVVRLAVTDSSGHTSGTSKAINVFSYPYPDDSSDGTSGTVLPPPDGTSGIVLPPPSVVYLEILDAAGFNVGTDISSGSRLFDNSGIEVSGAVCDGVTRLLLEAYVSSPGKVTFSLGQNTNISEEGILFSFLPGDNQDGKPQSGNTITVNAGASSDQRAFAIYQAPDNFVRTGHSEDLVISERAVSLNAGCVGTPALTKDIRLNRPPVVLVHGVWSSGAELQDLWTALAEHYSGLNGVIADYKTTNASNLSANYWVLPQYIAKARKMMQRKGVADIQVDVIAHSMGGLLSRLYATDKTEAYPAYYTSENCQKGWIHKLITIDTPHKGSFLADAAMARISNPVLVNLFLLSGHPLTYGAVADLRSNSGPISNMNNTLPKVYTHSIIGDYIVPSRNIDFIASKDLRLMYQILPWFGYNPAQDIMANRSDLVVSVDSQAGGLFGPTVTILPHDHLDIFYSAMYSYLYDLLDQSVTDTAFNQNGYPVQ